MNAMLKGALDAGLVNHERVVEEVNALVKWQTARKRWHQDKTRQKMANGGETETRNIGAFGFNEVWLGNLYNRIELCRLSRILLTFIDNSATCRTIFRTLNLITRMIHLKKTWIPTWKLIQSKLNAEIEREISCVEQLESPSSLKSKN